MVTLVQVQYFPSRSKTPSSSFQVLPTILCGPVLLPKEGAVLSMGGPTHLFEVWAYIEKLELVLCCNLRSVLVLCP